MAKRRSKAAELKRKAAAILDDTGRNSKQKLWDRITDEQRQIAKHVIKRAVENPPKPGEPAYSLIDVARKYAAAANVKANERSVARMLKDEGFPT